jgi:hypothetical protein
LHDVLLGFQALLAGSLGLGFSAGRDEVLETDDLGPNKPLLKIGVDGAGSFPRTNAFANRPGAIFFAADG